MKPKGIYIVAALMWVAAAIISYIADPAKWSMALMCLGLAVLFAAIGFAQKSPKA